VATTRSSARSLIGLPFPYLRGQRRECTGFTGAGYTNLLESSIAPKV
jgi:hypothetical protein